MKKLLILTICAMTVMAGCKNKGQSAPADENDSTAAGDSLIEQQDTTPLPMFIYIQDKHNMQVVYWTGIAKPEKDNDNAEYYQDWYDRWALQDMFRRNASQYTTLIAGGRNITVKYVDELLKNPDGEDLCGGELHGRAEIPSMGARFAFANDKDYSKNFGSMNVVVHDTYLKTRKQLGTKDVSGSVKKMPQEVIKKLEKQYGMKAERSEITCKFGENYVFGIVQFKGEWKNAPKLAGEDNMKKALALEVLVDGDSVYAVEKGGYYDPASGPSWNADDDGEYLPSYICAAFEGPDGLELCYVHGAPESITVGMLLLRDGKLIDKEYECYHSMYDEELPVWKKDFAEMRKLFQQKASVNKNVVLSKWAHIWLDENEWIRLHDSEDQYGGIFLRKDGKIHLIAVETPDRHATKMEVGNVTYLRLSGAAGETSVFTEIFGFKDGKQVEHFTMKESFGEIEECTLNGKPYSKEQGGAYADRLPQGTEIPTYWKEIEDDEKEQ